MALGPLAGLALERLWLDGTDVASLAGVPTASLIHLALSGTAVADLAPLTRAHRPRALQLARCPVRDLAPLAGLDELEELNLADTGVADGAAGQPAAAGAREPGAPAVHDVAALIELPALALVDVRGTGVTAAQAAALGRAGRTVLTADPEPAEREDADVGWSPRRDPVCARARARADRLWARPRRYAGAGAAPASLTPRARPALAPRARRASSARRVSKATTPTSTGDRWIRRGASRCRKRVRRSRRARASPWWIPMTSCEDDHGLLRTDDTP
ncbi:MAG: hypothetical protein IPL61_06980 [Myxococcales bacterium]|nr:hypothetical protein [Myxococcales bacterium]